MRDRFVRFVKYIAIKFPGPFMGYMRKQIASSEARTSYLYNITRVAYATTSLDEFYKSIHEHIGKLMHAENMYIALHDKEKDLINFPYYADKYDDFQGKSFQFDGSLLTCSCILEGIPVLFTKEEMLDYLNAASDNQKKIKGTLSEYWLGCPLMVGENKIGAIVVQSYENKRGNI